jgi:predicted metal-dependent hydrolase
MDGTAEQTKVFINKTNRNWYKENKVSELPDKIKKYYESLKDEEILTKIKHLTNMKNQLGSSEPLKDQLQEFKNEADRRGLKYQA